MNKQKIPSLRCVGLLAIFALTLVVIPALAQSTVPPTARQAAQSPAFASKLHPPAGGAHLQRANPSRSTRPSSQDQVIYDNGPYNGTTDAFTINFGFTVSDSFTVPANSSITGLHLVYWDASTTDLLTSVDMALGFTSFGGSFTTLTGVTNTFLGTNQYGYALYQADYAFGGIPWSGSGYITLQNACSTSGCSVSNPIYWDENSGPSTAYQNTIGSIPSEAFNLTGSSGSACFEDQPGSGFNTIYSFSGLPNQAYPVGVIIDQAGNLYGTANYGLSDGLVYRLAQTASGWLLNLLYSFAGGADGNTPSPRITKGPNGGVYGTSDGGIQGCGYYCGQVFQLRPRPSACRNSSCGWIEDVLYKFSGGSDGSLDDYSGGVVIDPAGNLYGASDYGGGEGCGGRGCGTVYKLTPSGGRWTESILYRFTGGSDGQSSSQVIVGSDGSLYGIAAGGFYGNGVVFQLTPSGSGWTENIVHAFQFETDGYSPSNLATDSFGNLYGLAIGPDTFPVVFKLSRSGTTWVLAETEFHHPYVDHENINNLVVDPAGNGYVTGGGSQGCRGYDCDATTGSEPYFVSYIDTLQGNDVIIFEEQLFASGGPLALDAEGNLYGTTVNCGVYNQGTVWKLSRQ